MAERRGTEDRLAKLRHRISVDPAVLAGKPVIRGTRLSVELILELLAGGWSAQDVLENYPWIVDDDLRACFLYAAELAAAERVFPLPAG